MTSIAPKPHSPRPIFFVISLLTGVLVGLSFALSRAPLDTISIIGAVLVGLIFAIILCVIVSTIPWTRIGIIIESMAQRIYEEEQDNGTK